MNPTPVECAACKRAAAFVVAVGETVRCVHCTKEEPACVP